MSKLQEVIGQRIFYARKEKELSQTELAALAKVDKNTIYLIEKAGVNASVLKLHKICKVLDVKMVDLFKGY